MNDEPNFARTVIQDMIFVGGLAVAHISLITYAVYLAYMG